MVEFSRPSAPLFMRYFARLWRGGADIVDKDAGGPHLAFFSSGRTRFITISRLLVQLFRVVW